MGLVVAPASTMWRSVTAITPEKWWPALSVEMAGWELPWFSIATVILRAPAKPAGLMTEKASFCSGKSAATGLYATMLPAAYWDRIGMVVASPKGIAHSRSSFVSVYVRGASGPLTPSSMARVTVSTYESVGPVVSVVKPRSFLVKVNLSPTLMPAPTALTVTFVSAVSEKTKSNVAPALVPVREEAAIPTLVASCVHFVMPPLKPLVNVPVCPVVAPVSVLRPVPAYAMHLLSGTGAASHSLPATPPNTTPEKTSAAAVNA